MKDDERKIVISRMSEYRQGESPFNQGKSGSSLNRWVAILGLVPVVIIMVILGAFFFAAFLALFVVAASVFGARIWWLRRKLRKNAQAEEGDYVDTDIEDAQIIEETKESQKKNH